MLAFVLLSVGPELLDGVGLGDFLAHKGLVLRREFLHLLLNLLEIALLDDFAVFRHHVIEEAVFYSRTESELDARVQLLESFCQQMG